MIVAISALIAIAGSMIYYFVFFRPEIAKAEIRLQEEKQAADELRIESEVESKKQEELDKKAALGQEVLDKKVKLVEALAEAEKWYNDSIAQANEAYYAQWNIECERLGRKPNSALPVDIVTILDDRHNKTINQIEKQYQSKKDDIYKLYE